MSNPNWASKKNQAAKRRAVRAKRAECRINGAHCRQCRKSIKLGDDIYLDPDDRWICLNCIHVIEARTPATGDTTRKPTGWEHDDTHVPHSMSYPCDTCAKIPVIRDIADLLETR